MATNPAQADDTSMKAMVERVELEVRRMGALSVMMSQTVAQRFGLHTTDLECLDLIFTRRKATAGELARATGLTSGAMTALLDRLERAGYIKRTHDTVDRRRVNVEVEEGAIEPIKAVYAPVGRRMAELWTQFTPDELETILRFLRQSSELGVACIEDVRGQAVSAKPRRNAGQRARG